MHVLILYPYVPSLRAGHGSAQVLWQLIEELSAQVRITLICQYRPHERALLPALEPLCRRLVALPRRFVEDMSGPQRVAEMLHTARGLAFTRDPLPALKQRRAAFAAALRRVLREDPPDVVQVELATLAGYVSDLGSTPSVLVDHEAGGLNGGQVSRWLSLMRRCYPRYSRVMALCAEDASAIAAAVPGLRVDVRPFAIEIPAQVRRRPEPGRVLFFGSAAHAPNRDALAWIASEVGPALRRRFPRATLACAGMVGRGVDPDELRRAGIEPLGFVEDLAAELARAAVVLAPVRLGRGVRTKNLEAMAHGVPLVTTGLGAHGVHASPERAFVVADTPEELARVTAELLEHPERAEELGAAGRRLVAAHHTRALQAQVALETWRAVAK